MRNRKWGGGQNDEEKKGRQTMRKKEGIRREEDK